MGLNWRSWGARDVVEDFDVLADRIEGKAEERVIDVDSCLKYFQTDYEIVVWPG
jgi:hypothetical protein